MTRGLALLVAAIPILCTMPRHVAAVGGKPDADASATFAIQAGRIYTMTAGGPGVLDDAVLVVRDGRIAAVGKDVAIPDGIPVHRFPNAVLAPGLIDASSRLVPSHRGEDSVGAQFLALDAFNSFGNYAEALSEGVTSAYLSPGSHRLVAGQGAVVKLQGGRVLRERADLVMILGEAAFATPPKQKIPFPSSEDVPIEPATPQRPHSRLGQFPELEAKFQEAREYAKGRASAKASDRPAYDPALEALAAALAQPVPARVDARRARDILQTLRHRNLFPSGLTLAGATEAHRVADQIRSANIPVILEVPVRFDAPGADRGLDPNRIDESIETAAALAAAKVRFALTALAQSRPGDLRMAAMTAVRGGLDPMIALASVTREAASILGIADRVGTLEPGKDADFVVLSGDPMRTTTSVLRTYVDGKLAWNVDADPVAGTGAESVVVRAGTIFTGSGEILRDGAVLIENGKIAAVGRTVPMRRGVRVIDAGPDAFVTPGFIDAHGHLGLENDQADPEPELSLAGVVAGEKANFRDVAASGVTTVLVAPYRPNRNGSQVLAMKTAGASRDDLVVADPAAVFFSVRGQDPFTEIDQIRGMLKKGKSYDEQWKKYFEDLKKWEEDQAKKKAEDAAKKKKDDEEKRKKEEEAKKAVEEKTPEEPKPDEEAPAPEVPPAPKVDPISGTWRATISGGPIPEPQEGSMKLKLDGTSVTGSLASPLGEEVELSGTFQGNQLTLELVVDTPFGAPKIEATLDREDHLVGKLVVGDFSLDFEADRTEKETPEIRVKKRKKAKDGRPEPPEVQAALEPYRSLFAGEIAALVDVQTGPQVREIVELFTREYETPLVLLNAEEAGAVSEAVLASKAGVVLPEEIVRRDRNGKIEVPAEVLSRLGIAVAFQSDAEDAARNLPYNVAYAVYHGMDATAALESLTITAARMFRIDDRVGSLEPGKDGDLLVFSGDPFEAASRLMHVIVSGKEVHQP